MKTFYIPVDPGSGGRTFEGIGGISSNGTSKLLRDYPSEQQEEILDLLFRPAYGASLHQLKLEIGSDANTSSGTEPSHMRAETDFDITRGTGLWLARQAVLRNPKLILEALRWGTPRWIASNGQKLMFYLRYLEGAAREYGIRFRYIGADENEGRFDRDWTVQTLRPGLDRGGFGDVGITAADSENDWFIADLAEADEALRQSLCALGIHYTSLSPANARASGLPLWLSEEIAPVHTGFAQGPLETAQRIITMYTEGRMTKCELHPLFEGNYESTPFTAKGMLTAVWPWSGHYRVEAGLWVVAQFTQFIQPGWRFQDSGCFWLGDFGALTLWSPDLQKVSVILLNRGGAPCRAALQIPASLPEGRLHVWASNAERQFIRQADLPVLGGEAAITLKPCSICTLTTTSGQHKGGAKKPVPGTTRFPLPYPMQTRAVETGRPLPFALDQAGAFEVCRAPSGEAYLRQMLDESMRPVDWARRETPDPYTLFGSLEWVNYTVRAEIEMEDTQTYILLGGRANLAPKSRECAQAYQFQLFGSGEWLLKKSTEILCRGAAGPLAAGRRYPVEITFCGDVIQVLFCGETLCSCQNGDLSSGQALLGSGYGPVRYHCFGVYPIAGKADSCVRVDDADARIRYSGGFVPRYAGYQTYGRTLTCADTPGAMMTFDFEGVGVSVIGQKGPDGGRAVAAVDGIIRDTADTYCPENRYRESIFHWYDLAPGAHRLTVRADGSRNGLSKGDMVCLDAIEVWEE